MRKKSVLGTCAALAVMAFGAAFLAGCATAPTRGYTGPELPGDRIARISVDLKTPPPPYSGRTSEKATIRALDGKEVKGEGLLAYPREVLVLPGQHQVLARVGGGANAMGAVGTAMMESAVTKWDAPLIFHAQAGKTYMIRFEYVKGPDSPRKEDYFNRNKGKLWVYWIEEAGTGEYVCGWRFEEISK